MAIELLINFLVGLVSFLSPCVLPLVPAYISYMGGRMTYSVSAQVDIVAEAGGTAKLRRTTAMRLSTFIHGLAFVAGFTFVFVALTVLATAFIQQIGSTRAVEGIIGRVGGMLIIFLGFHFMGAFQPLFKWLRKQETVIKNPIFSLVMALFFSVLIVWGFTGAIIPFGDDRIPLWTLAISGVFLAILWTFFVAGGGFTTPARFWNKAMNTIEVTLYADTRRQVAAAGTSGLGGSALLGVVFAAGWSPCIGPTLGAAMTLAAQQDNISTAAILITAYSLGLGIPFLITALMLDSAQGILRRLNKHMHTIKLVSGAVLVLIGVLVASGQLQQLSARLSSNLGGFAYTFDECAFAVQQGEIGGDQFNRCIAGEDYNGLVEEHRARNQTAPAPMPEATPEASAPSGVLSANISSIRETARQLPDVGLAVGQIAPNFTATTTTGNSLSLNDLRGKTVLLNFWFTSCEPCKKEMPAFQNAYVNHSDSFTVLAINRSESAEVVSAFGAELSLTFPLVLDPDGRLQAQFNIIGYPTTYLINPDGLIIAYHTGPLSDADIAQLIRVATTS